MLKKNLYIILFLLATLPIELFALPKPLIISGDHEVYQLGSKLHIYQDKNSSESINTILKNPSLSNFEQSTQDVPYLNFTSAAVWAYFSLHFDESAGDTWFLELAYPLMDNITFYSINPDNTYSVIKTGYDHPFETRMIPNRHFIFKLSPRKGETNRYFFRFTNSDRMEIPLILHSENHFYRKDHNEQYLMGIYGGIVLIIFFINITLAIMLRDRTSWMHALFILSFNIFQFTQNGYTYEYFTAPIFEEFNHYIPITIAFLMFTLLYFSTSFLDLFRRYPRSKYLIYPLTGLIALSVVAHFLVSYAVSVTIQMLQALIILLYIVLTIAYSLAKKYKPAILLSVGWGGIIAGGVMYAFKIAGILPSNFFVNHTMQIAASFHFILITFGLGSRVSYIFKKKEMAEEQVKISKERFNTLVEGSEQIILTMDDDFKIISANNAVFKYFMTKADSIIGKRLPDLVYEDNQADDPITRNYIEQKLAIFNEERTPTRFQAPFKASGVMEPKNMQVHLERIIYEGRSEILGRLSTVIEDSLLKYFVSETQTYEIGNYLLTANDITQRLTRNLQHYISKKKLNLVRIALREIIINSIEHGNLAVTYDEKSLAKEDGRYFELLAERRQDSRYSQRKVTVSSSIGPKKAVFTITDEGSGFNFKKYLDNKAESSERLYDSHGRGISMTKTIFDKIKYSKKGKHVFLFMSY